MSEIKDKIKRVIWAEYCVSCECDLSFDELTSGSKLMDLPNFKYRRNLLDTYADKIVKSLTPSDLAALAEPMGLALVPVEPTKEMLLVGVEIEKQSWPCDIMGVVYVLYKDITNAGRIKPKQAEKGKDDV